MMLIALIIIGVALLLLTVSTILNFVAAGRRDAHNFNLAAGWMNVIAIIILIIAAVVGLFMVSRATKTSVASIVSDPQSALKNPNTLAAIGALAA